MGNTQTNQQKLDKLRKETLKKYPHLEVLKEEGIEYYYKLPKDELNPVKLSEINSNVGQGPIQNAEDFAKNFNLDEFNRIFQENRNLLHSDHLIEYNGIPKKTM